MRLIDKDLVLKTAKDKEWGLWCEIANIKFAPEIDAIPVEWIKNKREELEKEYYDLFHVYTDESRNNQVQLLNDFQAFNTVLRYWEEENENRVEQ